MYTRNQTQKIKVGNIEIGGNNKVIIQSMCNIKTSKTDEVIKQINDLIIRGCEIIRVSVIDDDDALSIKEIKKRITIPLVADIHFDYKLAIKAIENGVDKIRINPGTLGNKKQIEEIINLCKLHDIPIRIGINGASLEKDIEEKWGSNNAISMIESLKRSIAFFESKNFKNIIISVKSSNVLETIKAYTMASELFSYPLHIGITEAGDLSSSLVRSSAGLGILLNEKIGNTIRISITGNPIFEIDACKELLSTFNLYNSFPKLISCPTCGRTNYDMLPIIEKVKAYLNTINNNISVAIMGCIVNGPGEAKNADIGLAGGNKEAVIFKKGKILKKVKEKDAADELINEIKNMIL
ncbi:MAG: flavodoxin-dependent (E)-4-hydroxy-3-methylbut-2-enyl-diphosphate synthase [Bacilli bacterium]|nr:flavodoxin-dependent (E)-4-hydroxy-3-methylbut-2-enyl-diphosphate synthase [Bacilli bacterium]